MGIRRWLWGAGGGTYDPTTGTVNRTRGGWLRELVWEETPTQNIQTGETSGGPRLLQRGYRRLIRHWQAEWKFWITIAVAVFGSATLGGPLIDHLAGKEEPAKAQRNPYSRPASNLLEAHLGLKPLDTGHEYCRIPLRCD
jgi:hypothetical protein